MISGAQEYRPALDYITKKFRQTTGVGYTNVTDDQTSSDLSIQDLLYKDTYFKVVTARGIYTSAIMSMTWRFTSTYRKQ
ncbi:hypothetical protein Y032_0004g2214 [Ancylostoma ceylanicum]|uniref:Uncharacterized protein n=1 Tax=Ancylostoma ceylanicum TaxID=53326 RepID=A0A016VW06_9BILA|nr:hypothetical protein Y032_0004g2214 [Ancylostoma ceylanicum]